MRVASPAVLVVGAEPTLTWSVARCLRRAGHAPVVLGRSAWSPMRCTTDCRRYLPWRGGPAQVRAVCDGARIETLVAADGPTAQLLAQERVPDCAVPLLAHLATLTDRWRLARQLRDLDLPAPDSQLLADAGQLLAHSLVYPIVTMPPAGEASVQRHADHAALERAVAHGRLADGFPLMAQSCVAGWKVAASFLAWRGRLTACAVLRHTRRGHTFYPSRRVREYVERLVAACGYSGAGQLDLRYDPARDSYFILKFSPQFGNSVLYAERAGLNLPALLLRADRAAAAKVALPRAGRVRLPLYERGMTLATRWLSVGSG